MGRLTYLAVLASCVLGTLPLELWLGTRVYRRPVRWLLAVAPTFVLFVGWDLYAISRRQWWYDPGQTVGVLLPGRLPVEEALFFLVVPTCAILAFEAVRAVRGWPAGDEPDRGQPDRGQPDRGQPDRDEPDRDEPDRDEPTDSAGTPR